MTKRQWAAVVAAVAAEVIVASVAVVVLVRHQRAGLPIGTLGVDIIAGPAIERADGTRVRLPLPADSSIRHAARVPGGWLIELFARSTSGVDGAVPGVGLWYVQDGPLTRPPRCIGTPSGHRGARQFRDPVVPELCWMSMYLVAESCVTACAALPAKQSGTVLVLR